MVRRSKQIWMFLSAVLLVMSTRTVALPLPTSGADNATLFTTEMMTLTTSSTIAPHLDENVNLSSVSTVPPIEMTIFTESDLFATTEDTPGGGNIFIDPNISARPSLSSEVPEVIHIEKDSMTRLIKVSSHPMKSNQNETVVEEVQTATAPWSSSALAGMGNGTLSPDAFISTRLFMNFSESKLMKEGEVSPKVPDVTAAPYPTSVEFLKSVGASKENTEIITNTPILTITEEYSTSEGISTSILPIERTLNFSNVGSEVPKPTIEVHLEFTEEITERTQELSEAYERVSNFSKKHSTSTEEVVKHTEELPLLKPTKGEAKRTEEDAEPKPHEETMKSTTQMDLLDQKQEGSERLEEVDLATKEVAVTTNIVKNSTAEAAKLHEEFEMQTIQESKPTAEVFMGVAVTPGNKSTKAEIFISSGFIPSKTFLSPSLGNPRGSRDFTEGANGPQFANATENQPEIDTPKSILTGLESNTSVTLSHVTTTASEQLKLLTSVSLQNNSAAGDELNFPSSSTWDAIEVNVLNATSPTARKESVTILSRDHSTAVQSTSRELSANTDVEKKNFSESNVTHSFEAENISEPNVTHDFGAKNVSEPNVTHDFGAKNVSELNVTHGFEEKNVSEPNITHVLKATNVSELNVNYGLKKKNVLVPNVTHSFEAKNVLEPRATHSFEAKNFSEPNATYAFLSKSFKELTSAVTEPATEPMPNSKVKISQSMEGNSETLLFMDTMTWVSSPSSVIPESDASTMERATGAWNTTIECSPEPVVSVFQWDVRYVIALGLTGCSVAATLLIVTLVLIRLRESKQRDTSPSLQICGCLGRTQRAEITPRRAEVSQLKPRPGCNLATDADCRAGEGEDVPLALSAGTLKVSASNAPVSMAVKPNGAPLPPPKPGDSPV